MFGYWATGRRNRQITPISTRTIASTFARTGCSIKNFDIIAAFPERVDCGQLRHDLSAGARPPQFADDDPIVGSQPRSDRAQAAKYLSQLNVAFFDNVVVIDDEQVTAALIFLQRPVRDKQRVARAALHRQSDAHKKARQQIAVRVCEHAAQKHCSCRGVDPGRDVFEGP